MGSRIRSHRAGRLGGFYMERWQMNRAGILNFWYYDEEEFLFEEGRLILRGTNGSGRITSYNVCYTKLLRGLFRMFE